MSNGDGYLFITAHHQKFQGLHFPANILQIRYNVIYYRFVRTLVVVVH